MRITRQQLDDAAAQGLISAGQAQALWSRLAEAAADTPSFRFGHILYYVGGMAAIGAMSLFMTLGWERLGGWGLLAIALAYAVAGIGLTEHLLRRRRLPVPAGIVATFVLALAPLAIYGLQSGLGYWAEGRAYKEYHTHIDWRWLLMELGTLAAGAVMLWRYRLSFLVMPVAVTLWYMSMDLTPFLFGSQDTGWALRKTVSLAFGLMMAGLALWVDLRTRSSSQDYPFWLYLFGVLAFWGALTMMGSDGELRKLLYLCVNLLMILAGALLSRRVFAVFGGIGAALYLWHLADTLFKDSVLFPFALTAIGLGIVWLGLLWQRNEARLAARLQALLPPPMRALARRRQGA